MVRKTGKKKKKKRERPPQSKKETSSISKKTLGTIADEWRTTFDAIKDAISLTDVEGKILRCNKAMSNLLGKSFQEIIGHTCWELMHGTSEPVDRCPIVRMKETLKKETMILPIDERILEVTADPIFDDSGGLSGAVHIITDITDRKKADDELKNAYEEILSRQNAILNLSEDLLKEVEERKTAEKKIREYSNQLRHLASQMSLIEEQERRRIASILHDSIGQNLALAKIRLEELKEMTSSESRSILLDEIYKTIDQTIHETRNITFDISPAVLYELGFEAAIEWLGDNMLKKHNIIFEFRDDRKPKPLSNVARLLLHQSVREFLTNIIKHSKAHKVKIHLQKDKKDVCIKIYDDGIGFDLANISSKLLKDGSFGLFSVRERLIRLGGHFKIDSLPGQGTQITLTAPLETEKRPTGH